MMGKEACGILVLPIIPSSSHLSSSSVNPVDKGLSPHSPFLPFPLFPPTSYFPQASLPPQAFQTSSSGCPKPMTLSQVSFTVTPPLPPNFLSVSPGSPSQPTITHPHTTHGKALICTCRCVPLRVPACFGLWISTRLAILELWGPRFLSEPQGLPHVTRASEKLWQGWCCSPVCGVSGF